MSLMNLKNFLQYAKIENLPVKVIRLSPLLLSEF